jgi:hypothetical protein
LPIEDIKRTSEGHSSPPQDRASCIEIAVDSKTLVEESFLQPRAPGGRSHCELQYESITVDRTPKRDYATAEKLMGGCIVMKLGEGISSTQVDAARKFY